MAGCPVTAQDLEALSFGAYLASCHFEKGLPGEQGQDLRGLCRQGRERERERSDVVLIPLKKKRGAMKAGAMQG